MNDDPDHEEMERISRLPPDQRFAAVSEMIDRMMGRVMEFYDRGGAPITYTRYCELKFDTPGYHRVARDIIPQGDTSVEVSTVWMGIPQSGGILQVVQTQNEDDGEPVLRTHKRGTGAPLIFETMVFCEGNDYTHRYATEAEAVAGHAEIVSSIREGRPITLEDQGLSMTLSVLGRSLGFDFLGGENDPPPP